MFDKFLLLFAMLCGWSLKAHLLWQRGVFLLWSDTKQTSLCVLITAPVLPVRWTHQSDNLRRLHISSIYKARGAYNPLLHISSPGLVARLPQRRNCRILCFSFRWEEKLSRWWVFSTTDTATVCFDIHTLLSCAETQGGLFIGTIQAGGGWVDRILYADD